MLQHCGQEALEPPPKTGVRCPASGVPIRRRALAGHRAQPAMVGLRTTLGDFEDLAGINFGLFW